MLIDQDKPITLHQLVSQWLDTKISAADHMRERFSFDRVKEPDIYTVKQLEYAKHLTSALKWAKSQLPKKWRDVLIFNDWVAASVMEDVINDLKEKGECR